MHAPCSRCLLFAFYRSPSLIRSHVSHPLQNDQSTLSWLTAQLQRGASLQGESFTRRWLSHETTSTSKSDELQDIFHQFPEFDNLSVNLKLSSITPSHDISSPKTTQKIHDTDICDLPEPPVISETETSLPYPLCGVPVLEELFRRNRDPTPPVNNMLMRILTHESVLYRGVMEKKRRVKRLAKFMDRERKLETVHVNRPWIVELGNLLRNPSFKFGPERFHTFHHDSGKSLKLAVPSSRDEVILDSMRLVLDAIFEPHFSDFSFGFRPGRGRQIALKNIRNHIRGMDYYIVGNLSASLQQLRGFEMVKIACRRIHDPLFERLMFKALDVGYVNTYGLKQESFVSVPREMGISPILLNCYLHSFDKWMEVYRNVYSDYQRPLRWPLSVPFSAATYRMLRYLRYGPTFFVGLRGKFAEAHAVASDIRNHLRGMELDTSLMELHVHDAVNHDSADDRAQFLGFEVTREEVPADMPPSIAETAQLQTKALFHVPTLQLRECFVKNDFMRMSKLKTWNPLGCQYITHWPVEHIVRYYDRLTTGLLEYYALADNFSQLNWFVYLLKRSCNLTVGRKLKLRSMKKVFDKYGRDLEVKDGDTVVATFPDRCLAVRPIVKDFYPELTPYLRRRRFITRHVKDDLSQTDNLDQEPPPQDDFDF